MALFGKKGRRIIIDNRILKSRKDLSDDDIWRLQFRANLMIKVSKIVSICVMAALALYILIWDRDMLARGNLIEQLVIAVLSIALCGIGANELIYQLIAKRIEGSFWTAYRQQYLINMASCTPGVDYVTYKEEPGLSYEEIRASVLVLCKYDKLCNSQDCLYGEMSGDNYRITNFKAGVPKRKGNGKMGELTIFRGILGMIWDGENNRLSKLGFMQIFSKDYSPKVAGFTAEYEFETGIEDFDENFKAYVEKPDLLDDFFNQNLIDALKKIENILKCPFALSFNSGTMFIAINGYHDIFEAKLDESVAEQKEEVQILINAMVAAKNVYDIARE